MKYLIGFILCLAILFSIQTQSVNAKNNSLQQLTQDNNHEYSPAIDGNWIVYARINSGSSIRDLVAYNLRTGDSSIIHSFTSTVDPNIRISNHTVIWTFWDDEQHRVFAYDLNTKQERILNDGTYPVFEIDIYKNYVVWIGVKTGYRDLFTYNLDTGESQQLTTDSTEDSSPSIYGDKIVLMRYVGGYRNIFVYDLSTDTLNRISYLTSDAFEPRIYKNIITWHTNSEVYLYNLTSNTTKVAAATADYPLSSAGFETAKIYGDNIVFCIKGFIDTTYVGQVYVYNVANETTTQITANIAVEREPDISNQFVVFTGETSRRDLYLYRY